MRRGRFHFPVEIKDVSLQGLSGATRVRFRGSIPHGKSKRGVALDVHPDLIVKIAAALLATKDCACDSEWQRKHRHHSELGWQPGHAIWHVENPERPMPCLPDGKVIDVQERRSLAEVTNHPQDPAEVRLACELANGDD